MRSPPRARAALLLRVLLAPRRAAPRRAAPRSAPPATEQRVACHRAPPAQGEMQDQPLGVLSRDNYPSLEFAEEIPTRNTARRFEYSEEQRNAGATRRIYRPMMSAGDLLRFLASDVARRSAAPRGGEEMQAAPRGGEEMQAALGSAVLPGREEIKVELGSGARACPDQRTLGLLACEDRRARLADLSARVVSLDERHALGKKRRRLLLKHDTELAFTQALADAYLCLLQRLDTVLDPLQ